MKSYFLPVLVAGKLIASDGLVDDVRSAIDQGDFALGEKVLKQYRSSRGNTPEALEALSWMGRGALAAKHLDQAEALAGETHALSLDLLKGRKLDAEDHLPLALGASIEVKAQVLAARGERPEALQYLRAELKLYHETSIRARIQKNINLLNLEGKPAPPIDTSLFLGAKPPSLAELKGKPVVLFFWAHWCSDCKVQAPILARLAAQFHNQGLVVVGPTQRYGYAAGGEETTPQQELEYIDKIRGKYYGGIAGMSVPVSEENFRAYGSSTTPTLVLVDRSGIVRLYHPGRMSEAELAPKIRALL